MDINLKKNYLKIFTKVIVWKTLKRMIQNMRNVDFYKQFNIDGMWCVGAKTSASVTKLWLK